MKVSYELDLNTFEAWSGGKDTLDRIKQEGKVEECEALLEDLLCGAEEVTETTINDILWFEDDFLFENLGIRTYDAIKEELDEKREELAELENQRDEEVQEAREDEDYTEEDIQDIIDSYEDDLNDLKEEIEELKEELENA